jgi:tRNA threonylcarbamoyladenosine biosynthesis protein TsaE
MILPFSKISESEDETCDIAKQFALILKDGDIVALNGNLGTGKTFFIKNVCSEFNIGDVDSPTFSIINEYNHDRLIFHFDFYRIKKIEELYDIGIEEYLNDEQAIKFIEWAELVPGVIKQKHYVINFKYVSENSREIIISLND